MSDIRISVNKNIEQVLTELEENYKTLNRSEIFKVGLAHLYNDVKETKTTTLSDADWRNIEKARQEIREGKYTTLKTPADIDKFFEIDS